MAASSVWALVVVDIETGPFPVIDGVVIFVGVEQPAFEPSVNDGATLALGLFGVALLHHRPDCALPGVRGIGVALAVGHPLRDVVENPIEGFGGGVRPRARRRPWLDNLDGIAVGV